MKKQQDNWNKSVYSKLRDIEWRMSRNTSKFIDRWWKCSNRWSKCKGLSRIITVATVEMMTVMVVVEIKAAIIVATKIITKIKHHR